MNRIISQTGKYISCSYNRLAAAIIADPYDHNILCPQNGKTLSIIKEYYKGVICLLFKQLINDLDNKLPPPLSLFPSTTTAILFFDIFIGSVLVSLTSHIVCSACSTTRDAHIRR